jgi:hypothetical protein
MVLTQRVNTNRNDDKVFEKSDCIAYRLNKLKYSSI